MQEKQQMNGTLPKSVLYQMLKLSLPRAEAKTLIIIQSIVARSTEELREIDKDEAVLAIAAPCAANIEFNLKKSCSSGT